MVPVRATLVILAASALLLGGCVVGTVAGAAVGVAGAAVGTATKVTTTTVGVAADVTGGAVRTVTGSGAQRPPPQGN